MKFVTYEHGGTQAIGLLDAKGSSIIPLREAEKACLGGASLPGTMQEFIAEGEAALAVAKKLLAAAPEKLPRLPLASARLLAPVPRPVKSVLCVGRNYLDHVKETDASNPVPEHPIIFTKPATSVVGPEAVVDLHADITASVDYEGELAVIIGKTARKVAEASACEYVFGYTIINDVSARDLQKRHTQWVIGKGLDTFCPMGPYILHASAMADPARCGVQTRVNGELRQDGNTKDLIFSIPFLISLLSQGMTLEPGDIIATGTPQGVGAGFTPPRFLRKGDVVEISVTGLGVLRNSFA